jgi:hypothetical protein
MVHRWLTVAWQIAAALGPIFSEKSDSTTPPEAQFKDCNRTWLRLHGLRTLVSDIPAFLSFLAATVSYFHN